MADRHKASPEYGLSGVDRVSDSTPGASRRGAAGDARAGASPLAEVTAWPEAFRQTRDHLVSYALPSLREAWARWQDDRTDAELSERVVRRVILAAHLGNLLLTEVIEPHRARARGDL